tara:strand:- start:189 stop:371 length:183 start_codon:yes stop_codon:yes gene_type:complete
MNRKELRQRIGELERRITNLKDKLYEEGLRSQKWMLKFEHQEELTRMYKEVLERNKSLEE